ncbi:hypothetical protein PF672P1_00007 [Parabacteroides phage PF672P1]|nr:hypothetical protein PF672P1_00007 [Parabacteroides phage PF672P1]
MEYLEEKKKEMKSCLTGLGLGHNNAKASVVVCLRESISDYLSDMFFIDSKKEIYFYKDGRFSLTSPDMILSIIRKVMKEFNVGVIYTNETILRKIRKTLIGKINLEFKRSRNLISFNNGILDLNTYAIHRHSINLMPLAHFDCDYEPEAKCPLWEDFLRENIGDDQAVKLQEFLSLVFIDKDEVNPEVAMSFTGDGYGVKSVVRNTIKNVFGDNYSAALLSQICKGSSSDFHTAAIDFKLVNFAHDMDSFDLVKSRFKSFLSRNSILARNPRTQTFYVDNLPLIIGDNLYEPNIDRKNSHIWNNIIIIRFKDYNVSPIIINEIELEKSGIINWLIAGRKRIINNNGIFTFI